MWVPGLELWSPGLVANTFTNSLSHLTGPRCEISEQLIGNANTAGQRQCQRVKCQTRRELTSNKSPPGPHEDPGWDRGTLASVCGADSCLDIWYTGELPLAIFPPFNQVSVCNELRTAQTPSTPV